MTESGAKLIVVFVALGCAIALLWSPRSVPLREPPALRLNAGEAASCQAQDRSRTIPDAAVQRMEAMEALLKAHHLVEHESASPDNAMGAKRDTAHTLARSLIEEYGADVLWAVRARAVAKLDELLFEADPDARKPWIGEFEEMLLKYGAMSPNGYVLAPTTVVHALYKARWNTLFGESPTAGLCPIEVEAYWGWLALHAIDAPLDLRMHALKRYADAGGEHVDEAWAAFGNLSGNPSMTLHALGKTKPGLIRLTNARIAAKGRPSDKVDSERRVP